MARSGNFLDLTPGFDWRYGETVFGCFETNLNIWVIKERQQRPPLVASPSSQFLGNKAHLLEEFVKFCCISVKQTLVLLNTN